MTIDEARAAVEQRLLKFGLKKPDANVSLAQTRAMQQVRGPRLVRTDGTIGLGSYGSVEVTGMTLSQAKKAIEEHLGNYFLGPEVSVDVVGFNSKVYYVVFDGGGAGQQVIRFPITGSETVLDAIGQMYGLGTVSDKRHIWISRPAPAGCEHQVLPVDWRAITEQGDTQTNYQVLPGDRIFVKAYDLVKLDVALARLIAPAERLLGVVLLGSTTVRSFGNSASSGSTP
jgi:polysaccharide export outer membrane protein